MSHGLIKLGIKRAVVALLSVLLPLQAFAQGAGSEAWEELGHGFATAGQEELARRSYANALNAKRGEATAELPGRDLKQKIFDEAVIEERDEHGVPRLRG